MSSILWALILLIFPISEQNEPSCTDERSWQLNLSFSCWIKVKVSLQLWFTLKVGRLQHIKHFALMFLSVCASKDLVFRESGLLNSYLLGFGILAEVLLLLRYAAHQLKGERSGTQLPLDRPDALTLWAGERDAAFCLLRSWTQKTDLSSLMATIKLGQFGVAFSWVPVQVVSYTFTFKLLTLLVRATKLIIHVLLM